MVIQVSFQKVDVLRRYTSDSQDYTEHILCVLMEPEEPAVL